MHWRALAALLTLSFCAPLPAQDVRLDLPEEVELQALVEYVASTLELNVIYDRAQLNKRVALRAATPAPRDSLLDLLRAVLGSHGLALVEAEQSGWLRIVPAERWQAEGGGLKRELPDAADSMLLLTFVLSARFVEPEQIKTALTPYLSKPGGAIQTLEGSRTLVITDTAGALRRMLEIAELVDVEGARPAIETIPVRRQPPDELAKLVGRLLAEQARGSGAARGAAQPSPITLEPDPISGGLIVLGSADQIQAARKLIEQFDVAVERVTEIYQPRFIVASRLRTLAEQLLGSTTMKLVADDASHMLIASASPREQREIRSLLERFDTALGGEDSACAVPHASLGSAQGYGNGSVIRSDVASRSSARKSEKS